MYNIFSENIVLSGSAKPILYDTGLNVKFSAEKLSVAEYTPFNFFSCNKKKDYLESSLQS